MPTVNRKVLLLGWDDRLRLTEPTGPAPLALTQALATQNTLSVILPHLPTGERMPNAHVTGLGDLSLLQFEQAAGGPVARPAGEWEAPAAPYIGASADLAEPSTTPFASQESPLAHPAAVAPTAAPVAQETSAPAGGAANPAAAPEEAPATPALPLHLVFSNDQATLAEALEALHTSEPSGADLNFRVIQYARFATRLANAEDFEVIYASEWPVWLAGLEIRHLTGRPLVLHVHSLATDRNSANDRGWGLELERLALRRADLVLATSEAIAQRLREEYDLPAERLCVVDAQNDVALSEALRMAG